MPNPDLLNFAFACYARPGVEAACLELQAHGADVCLLLCAAWLEARGIGCSSQRLQALEALAAPWQQQVVQPLRTMRQAWRPLAGQDADLQTLRERLKGLELDAERSLLQRLQALSGDWTETLQPSQWLQPLAPSVTCRAALDTLRRAARLTHSELAGA